MCGYRMNVATPECRGYTMLSTGCGCLMPRAPFSLSRFRWAKPRLLPGGGKSSFPGGTPRARIEAGEPATGEGGQDGEGTGLGGHCGRYGRILRALAHGAGCRHRPTPDVGAHRLRVSRERPGHDPDHHRTAAAPQRRDWG